LSLLFQVCPNFQKSTAPHGIFLSGILDRSTEQRERIAFRFVIDLQEAEGFADVVSDRVTVARELASLYALGDDLNGVHLWHYIILAGPNGRPK
jgi:hypothetical protein